MSGTSAVHIIINPSAACGRAMKNWGFIRENIHHFFRNTTERFTENSLHACELARQAVEENADLIISVGGDGTFNEVVQGVLSTAHDALPDLAILPIGSGTDFVRSVGIPHDLSRAIDIIKEGGSRTIDIGKVVFKSEQREWTRYFANVFDIGLGGAVVRIANRIPKSLGGFLIYLLSSLSALITFRPVSMEVWIDDVLRATGEITIIGAANGQFFGGGMHLAPMASVSDGLLDILYVREPNLVKFIIHVLARVYEGKHLEYHNVHHLRGRIVHVKCSRVCLMDIDGEEDKAQEVTISVIPNALKIRGGRSRMQALSR